MKTAVVSVPIATLWTDPARVRPVDKPAFHGDVRGWVAAMTLAERADLDDRTETQLLLGERVIVDQVDGEYARVAAIGQPAARADDRGYPGWVNAGQLSAEDGQRPEPTHVVAVSTTSITERPHGRVQHADVALGTALTVDGAPVDGWLPLAGGGFVASEAVAIRPTRPPSGPELVSTASLLIGTPYVWGGLSALGIDCSGLVHVIFRRLGLTVPRNASDQAEATVAVELGAERAGDLYFFQRPGGRVHHVGFVAAPPDSDGTRHMLHACGTRRGVVREPMTAERQATLACVRRVI